MRIVFMGTPDFAVPCLKELIKEGHDIVGVFTQPDKPVGRKQIITPPPVKKVACENGLNVYQLEKMKDGAAFKIIEKLCPELIVVVAYGKILPKDILDFPKNGCINIHGSLLPKLRGAAPIQWSVINGEKYAGVTSMRMDEGLDTGDMILKEKVEIGENETSGQLYDRLSEVGANVLRETIELIKDGKIVYEKQNDSDSTYASLLDKKISIIDWNDSARNVHNKIRGLNPWPVASSVLNGRKIKILKSKLAGKADGKPGEIIADGKKLLIVCGDENAVCIEELQPEGKKVMTAEAFLAGNKILPGTLMGE